MAEFDGRKVGRNIMSEFVIEIDIDEIKTAAFGLFGWRLRVARILVWTAAKILRTAQCGCGDIRKIPPHACPYKSEIENDESLCTCCDECARECDRSR